MTLQFSYVDEKAFREAVETWGEDAQIDMAVEECGELIVALEHLKRGRANEDDVAEELADIRIMYEQLSRMIGQERVNRRVLQKMDRLRERIDEAEP